MTNQEIAVLRLRNHRLIGKRHESPEDAVRWSCAVQSQDYPAAKWGLGLRLEEPAESAIDSAFNDGRILRTHVMRPTWHFVLPADIRWMLELTRRRVYAIAAPYHRKLELDDELLARTNALLAEALQGGRQLQRKELTAVLESAGVPAKGVRLGFILMRAELDGVICSGARQGKQFTWALLDDRVPPMPSMDRDEALAMLARRYLASHGPATWRDFAWWSGLSATDARAAVEMVRSDFASHDRDDRTYWFPEPDERVRRVNPTIHLLPNYDEHIVAYKHHDVSFDPVIHSRLDRQSDVLMAHIIVMNGLVTGGWRRKVERKQVVIETQLLVKLSRADRNALKEAAAAYSEFLGMPVTLA
jgi:hypothetical protein